MSAITIEIFGHFHSILAEKLGIIMLITQHHALEKGKTLPKPKERKKCRGWRKDHLLKDVLSSSYHFQTWSSNGVMPLKQKTLEC